MSPHDDLTASRKPGWLDDLPLWLWLGTIFATGLGGVLFWGMR